MEDHEGPTCAWRLQITLMLPPDGCCGLVFCGGLKWIVLCYPLIPADARVCAQRSLVSGSRCTTCDVSYGWLQELKEVW